MTMYVTGNPKAKKQLKEMLANGRQLMVFSAGLGIPERNGVETVCGPQFPQPHMWYARVQVKDGVVQKVVG